MGPQGLAPPLAVGRLLARFFAYLFVCGVLWRLARIPRKRVLMTAAVVLPIALLCASCGGGCSSNSTSPPPPPTQHGRPPGAFLLTANRNLANLNHASNV